jgi:hypothetical protein
VSWGEIYRAHGVELAWEDWSRGIGTQNGFDPYVRSKS